MLLLDQLQDPLPTCLNCQKAPGWGQGLGSEESWVSAQTLLKLIIHYFLSPLLGG